MLWVLGLILSVWAIGQFYLRGEDLRVYDHPRVTPRSNSPGFSQQHANSMAFLQAAMEGAKKLSLSKRLHYMRAQMDAMSDELEFAGRFVPVLADSVAGEWVLAENSDPDRRLMCIHGGAFMMGSPISHRSITSTLARITGTAVLAVDYRLMPEHRRMAGIEDCRTAYRWILDNGPAEARPVGDFYVVGDSAGGNLALSVINWARDQHLREASAVVALSPITDSSLSGASVRGNEHSDALLAPMLSFANRLPKFLLLWVSWIKVRIRPSSPIVSPVFDDLSSLPPTLIQASNAEMLRDDAQRYVNKANAQGSAATLQTWNKLLHVWHMFQCDLPEAEQSFEEIRQFIARHSDAFSE